MAKLGALQQLATSMAAKTSEIPHPEKSCLQYVEIVGNLQEIAKQQAALVASKQESSDLEVMRHAGGTWDRGRSWRHLRGGVLTARG